MKNIVSKLRQWVPVAMLTFALGCGSDKADTTIQPEQFPMTNGEQQTIPLNRPVSQLSVEHTDLETIFETREVPSICTRTVQRGTHPECHTEHQQQCSTRMERECRNVPFPVCQTIQENVCRNVPDQVCHSQTVPVCQTVQHCRTENDRVCRGTPPNQQCTNVPRRVCSPVQQCHNETRRVCEQITRRECRIETRQSCHTETRQECRDVPRQHCENVPRQVCIEVPTMVVEQYPCTRPERVPVGERVILHQVAQVTIHLINPRNIDVSRDLLTVTLNNGNLSAVVQSASGIQYQIRQTSRNVTRNGPIEELITASFEVTVLY